jgi:acetyl-CoA acetyltransferase
VAPTSLAGQFEQPYGPMGPPTLFTIPVLRYMKTYGLTHEQLAMVSVVQREWAAKNPRATFRAPITVEDVLNSRMIAYPFRLLQCCLVTDGGGALILVAAERARDFPQSLPLAANRRPVYLLGTGESVESPMVSLPVIPAKAGSQGRCYDCTPGPRFRGVTKGAPPRAPSASPAPRPSPRPPGQRDLQRGRLSARAEEHPTMRLP